MQMSGLVLLAVLISLQGSLASYIAHVYWPRHVVGYYHIPVLQKVKYTLPAPEEIGQSLQSVVVPAPPPPHEQFNHPVQTIATGPVQQQEISLQPNHPTIVSTADHYTSPTAIESAGTILKTPSYQHASFSGPVLVPANAPGTVAHAEFIPGVQSGSIQAPYDSSFVSYGDKQYNEAALKADYTVSRRVPKNAISPSPRKESTIQRPAPPPVITVKSPSPASNFSPQSVTTDKQAAAVNQHIQANNEDRPIAFLESNQSGRQTGSETYPPGIEPPDYGTPHVDSQMPTAQFDPKTPIAEVNAAGVDDTVSPSGYSLRRVRI